MTEAHITPDSIVVAVDGSDHADQALSWAADQAMAEKRSLTVVHVVAPIAADIPVELTGERGTAGRELLMRTAEIAAAGRPELEVSTALRAGDPREVLLDLAQDARLLVMGSRGRGRLRSLLLGSVSAAVSRHAACPVVVVRPASELADVQEGVLVGADGTPESRPVLEFAFRQASLRGLPVTVLHSFWDVAAAYGGDPLITHEDAAAEERRRHLAESVAGLAEDFPDVTVTHEVNRGNAVERLTQGRPWTLVVVGHRQPHGLARITSTSTAMGVLERVHGTVVVVPEAAAQVATAS